MQAYHPGETPALTGSLLAIWHMSHVACRVENSCSFAGCRGWSKAIISKVDVLGMYRHHMKMISDSDSHSDHKLRTSVRMSQQIIISETRSA